MARGGGEAERGGAEERGEKSCAVWRWICREEKRRVHCVKRDRGLGV